MRIVFLYRSPADFTVETPLSRPLGGTESGLSYLSVELARLGHSVTVLNNTSAPGTYLGVQCLNHRTGFTPALLNGADVAVVLSEACGRELRDKGVKAPMVIWVHHLDDQPAIQDLQFTRERKAWTGYAFVSQWQLDEFADVFWIPREKCHVTRNAVAPSFLNLPAVEPWFKRGTPPVLVYSSMPYRGLSVLLDAFPQIRAAVPDVRLKVFSNMARVEHSAGSFDYSALDERCRTMAGIDHIGPVGQSDLARELSQAAALAYPSIYLETSCIAAMEAMAAGLAVLTTRSGALPETTAGFGNMIELQNDPAKLAQEFSAMTVQVLHAMRRNPDPWSARREAQIANIRNNVTWPVRAREWSAWLPQIVARGA